MKALVEGATGAVVLACTPLGGGTFGALFRIDLADGRRLVAKTVPDPAKSTLETEGWMLGYLAANSPLPVPAVHHVSGDLLVMDLLDSGGALDARSQRDAADHIAALHEVRGPVFGLARDTVIGPLPQDNTESDGWVAFLRDRRLMPMGRAAFEAGNLSRAAMSRLERFCARLDDIVPEPAFPSLLHGDLWTGNVLVGDGRISGFIDPAIYYGDPEMDLAFSTLFGTFDEAFFSRYAERRPLARDFFESRRDICNLWPLLVHARLFGAGYGASADRIVSRFVGD